MVSCQGADKQESSQGMLLELYPLGDMLLLELALKAGLKMPRITASAIAASVEVPEGGGWPQKNPLVHSFILSVEPVL